MLEFFIAICIVARNGLAKMPNGRQFLIADFRIGDRPEARSCDQCHAKADQEFLPFGRVFG